MSEWKMVLSVIRDIQTTTWLSEKVKRGEIHRKKIHRQTNGMMAPTPDDKSIKQVKT